MKVLVSDNLSATGVEILKKESGIEVDVKTGLPKEELIKIIPNYDGLIVRSATKVVAEIIDAASNLKVIGRAGIGVDNIDVEAAGKKGIIVMNAPEGNIITTAEHTMALLMSLSRNIPQANAALKNKKWSPKEFMGVELFEKNLGIIGLGRIGSIVAERAHAFHMKILVYDPYISQERAEKLGVELVDLPDLLGRSDFLTLHTPGLSGKPLLGKEEFGQMKPGIRIVNCARGSLIDDSALIEAVQSKQVAGAALDVYHKEPLDLDSPLLQVNEIICTPHLGASTEEAQEKVAIAICDQIIDYLKYGNVRNAVNVPSIDAETLGIIKPYLVLGEDLGNFISQLVDGPVTRIDIQYNGEVSTMKVEPITIAILKGLFNRSIEGINMVNAPFIAKERGIEVQESKSSEVHEYTSTIQVRVTSENGTRKVTGSIFGKGDSRIVQFDEYNMEAVLSKNMLVLKNMDVPGVIGNLGNVLGKNNLNIAGFHLGRRETEGKAIAIINIDSPPTTEALRELRNTSHILSVDSVTL
ncbi:MAG: phosphoglycerate dehydrogenase [Nitrospinae bacterium CG22_combo_CG10-13_8_21_14_all_47_10]|nr:MAG: phosphoglycerate dehydrogenase [Nitrospinae bacterium CG22_combo_CG10-13_8_21_14_all_47_10]